MLTNSKLMALTPPHQFARMALAYLDSAQSLCQIMENDVDTATYEKGAVVLFLTAHGLELFLKGAILHKSPQETFKHHRIEELHNRYQTLYPQRPYALSVLPFVTQDLGMTKAEFNRIKSDLPDASELYRYPVDRNAVPWTAAIGFEARWFTGVLNGLRADFLRVMNHLHLSLST